MAFTLQITTPTTDDGGRHRRCWSRSSGPRCVLGSGHYRLLHVGDVEAVWPRLSGLVALSFELLIPLNSPLVSDFVLVLCHHLDAKDLAQVDFEEVEDRRPL